MRLTVFVNRDEPESISVYKGKKEEALTGFAEEIFDDDPDTYETLKNAKRIIRANHYMETFDL